MNSKLILLTHPGGLMTEQNLVRELLDEDLPCLHVRKDSYSEEDYLKWLNKVPRADRDRLILHQYPKLAEKYKVGAVHFKSTDTPQKSTLTRGQSVHSIEEIKGDLDYYYLSPIFQSISKPDYQTGLNTKEVERWLKETERSYKVYALGGINDENAKKALEMGFDGVVALGYVWQEIHFFSI